MEIEQQGEWVAVRVRDCGKGFARRKVGNVAGGGLWVGIGGMRERVRQFGGELTVSSAEAGALVEAKIPVLG